MRTSKWFGPPEKEDTYTDGTQNQTRVKPLAYIQSPCWIGWKRIQCLGLSLLYLFLHVQRKKEYLVPDWEISSFPDKKLAISPFPNTCVSKINWCVALLQLVLSTSFKEINFSNWSTRTFESLLRTLWNLPLGGATICWLCARSARNTNHKGRAEKENLQFGSLCIYYAAENPRAHFLFCFVFWYAPTPHPTREDIKSLYATQWFRANTEFLTFRNPARSCCMCQRFPFSFPCCSGSDVPKTGQAFSRSRAQLLVFQKSSRSLVKGWPFTRWSLHEWLHAAFIKLQCRVPGHIVVLWLFVYTPTWKYLQIDPGHINVSGRLKQEPKKNTQIYNEENHTREMAEETFVTSVVLLSNIFE